MAKLYFKYGMMNAQKSMQLLATAHNYEESGKSVLVLTPSVDERYGVGKVTSRIGIQRDAHPIENNTPIYEIIKAIRPHVVLVDECQFLNKQQITQLADAVTNLEIPVICYGLLKDFTSTLFEGAQELIQQGAELQEVKTMCATPGCTRKATHVLRLVDGVPVYDGPQVLIGGNDSYKSVCRRHYYDTGVNPKLH